MSIKWRNRYFIHSIRLFLFVYGGRPDGASSGGVECYSKRSIFGIFGENNFLSNRCRLNRLCGGDVEDGGDCGRCRTSIPSPGEINGRCFTTD